MNLREFPLLADENIDAAVVDYLREEDFDVIRSVDAIPAGASDVDVLRAATDARRVVITHDRDFGTLAIAARQAFVGIVFLRPGHIESSLTIGSLRTLLGQAIAIRPPFVIVVERAASDVRVRLRQPIV